MGVIKGVKDIVTGLTTAGGKELGKGLIEAAQKQNREAFQSAVVGHVQTILVQLSKQRDYRASVDANIALLEAKARAIEAGEFTVSTYGAITFNDKALQEGVVSMRECTNCGYGGRRDLDSVPTRRDR